MSMLFTRNDLQSMMNELFIEPSRSAFSGPSSKVETGTNDYTIKLAIPGIKSEEVAVEFDRAENTLEISYEAEGSDFVDPFKKSYRVPSTVDYDGISADFDAGVLTITLPKKKDQSKIKIM